LVRAQVKKDLKRKLRRELEFHERLKEDKTKVNQTLVDSLAHPLEHGECEVVVMMMRMMPAGRCHRHHHHHHHHHRRHRRQHHRQHQHHHHHQHRQHHHHPMISPHATHAGLLREELQATALQLRDAQVCVPAGPEISVK
jgi:hypothetical protein